MSDTSVHTNGAATVSHAPDPMQQNAAPCSAEKNAFVADATKPLENPDLTDRQLQAIEQLLQGQSDARVAQTLGVNRATIYRWRTAHAPFHQPPPRLAPYHPHSQPSLQHSRRPCTHTFPTPPRLNHKTYFTKQLIGDPPPHQKPQVRRHP